MDKRRYITQHVTDLKPTIPKYPILGINPSMRYENYEKQTRRVKYAKVKGIKLSSSREYNEQVFTYLKEVLESPDIQVHQTQYKKKKFNKIKESDFQESIIKVLKSIDQSYLRDGRIGQFNKGYSIEELQLIVERLGMSSAGKRKRELIEMIRDKLADYGLLL